MAANQRQAGGGSECSWPGGARLTTQEHRAVCTQPSPGLTGKSGTQKIYLIL